MTRFFLFLLLCATAKAATLQRIWLSLQREEPTHVTVNWETAQPEDSEVSFGTGAALGGKIAKAEQVTLHHIEIPIPEKDVTYHYQVRSGGETSAVHAFKGMPSKELRVAVVGDWGFCAAGSSYTDQG